MLNGRDPVDLATPYSAPVSVCICFGSKYNLFQENNRYNRRFYNSLCATCDLDAKPQQNNQYLMMTWSLNDDMEYFWSNGNHQYCEYCSCYHYITGMTLERLSLVLRLSKYLVFICINFVLIIKCDFFKLVIKYYTNDIYVFCLIWTNSSEAEYRSAFNKSIKPRFSKFYITVSTF